MNKVAERADKAYKLVGITNKLIGLLLYDVADRVVNVVSGVANRSMLLHPVNEACVNLSSDEIRIIEYALIKRNCRFNRSDSEFIERPSHCDNSLLSR